MDWENEAQKALKRINELEKQVSPLKSRMDSHRARTRKRRRKRAGLKPGTTKPKQPRNEGKTARCIAPLGKKNDMIRWLVDQRKKIEGATALRLLRPLIDL